VITGVHAVIFTSDAEGVRAFFRDVLGLSSVDAGGGWLIFALPPAELAAHPTDGEGHHELYLMCDDVQATVEERFSSRVGGEKGRSQCRMPCTRALSQTAAAQRNLCSLPLAAALGSSVVAEPLAARQAALLGVFAFLETPSVAGNLAA
jgi:catechol 2,3-dioxygenase-like lactoylglutathione lyase family enzyme